MKCYNCECENPDKSKFCSNCGCTLAEKAFDYPLLNGRYKVLEIIDAGGMSTVLKAEDQNLGNSLCAIKEMSNNFKNQKEQIYAVQKFKDEAFILAKMRHQNIPVVTDYFVENDKYYIVMDYIKGKTLKQLLRENPSKTLSEDDVKNIGIQMCGILEYLHSLTPPIIHRDLKPSNFLMEDETGKVILIDFGIARKFEPEKTGTLIGTPGYMAPEQYTGKIDLRSDIFGLGATLHHLLTGEDPTSRESLEFSMVRDLRNDVSTHMESVINKSVENDPVKRFNSATELKTALIQKGYLDMPKSTNKAPFKPSPPPRLLPTYLEISKKTNIKPSLQREERTSATKKASKATAIPSSERFINVQLQSFLDKENIRHILEEHVGIDIGTMNIKILQMDVDDRYFMYPSKIIVIPTPPSSIKDGLIVEPEKIGEVLTKVFSDCDIKATKAITSIPKNRGHFHSCLLQEMTDTKIHEIIPDLVKQHFPFYDKGSLIDYQVIQSYMPGQGGSIEVLLAGVEKEILDGLKQAIKEGGLELSSIKFQPFLLNQAMNFLVSENIKSKSLAIVDIGAENTSINIVKDGCLWYTSIFPLGGNDLTRAIAEKLNLDFKKAETLKKKRLKLNLVKGATETESVLFSLVTGLIKNLLNEIMQTLEDFKIKYKIVSALPVLFCGGTSLIKNFDRYIENELRVRCFTFKMPVSKMLETNRDVVCQMGPSLMVSFSLAMNKLLREQEQIVNTIEISPQKDGKKNIWNILNYKIF